MDNNKMDNDTKQTLLETSEKRHNEFVNDQKKQNNKANQYNKLIKKVDNGASVNADTIQKLGNEINIFVDDQKNTAPAKNIGCFKSKYNMTYKSDMKTFDHPNVVGTLGSNFTFDDCKKAAVLANKPYFAIGPGYTDDIPNSKVCIVGEGSEVFDFDTGKEAVEVVEYDNLLSSNKHFVSNGGNPNGFLGIKDGTINFYSNTNNYFTSYDNIFNYSVLSNTSYYNIDNENIKDYLIATNDPYYLKNPDARINYLAQELLNNNDNDVNSFQKVNQTICNRLTGTGKVCVGYTHVRNQDGSNIVYFFNKLPSDLKITNAVNRTNNNFLLADTYAKIEYPDTYLTINNDGSLTFLRKKSGDFPEKTYTLIPTDTETSNIISSKNFINNRKYGKNFLKNGESLYHNEFIASDNGKYRARVKQDGNLVIERATYGCYKDQYGNEVGSNTFNLKNSKEPNINIYSVNGGDYNINTNTKLVGGEVIEYINTNNQGDCLKKCNANQECSAFSYIDEQQKCIFYKNSKNTPSEYNKKYPDKLFEKTNDNNNVDKQSDVGKLGYIDNTGKLLEYSPEDISFKDEYYQPQLDIVYKVKDTRQNYYSDSTDPKNTVGNRNDNYFSSTIPSQDILITNPDMMNKKNEYDQLPEYISPYYEGVSDLTDKCKDKCSSTENCAGFSTGTMGENSTKQQCFLYNKEVYQKGEKTSAKNMKTYMKKVTPKNDISITNQVVKTDETTWNSFPHENDNMNKDVTNPAVNKQNAYNTKIGDILAEQKIQRNAEKSDNVEGYSNYREGFDIDAYQKLYEDRFNVYKQMKASRTPLKSALRSQETSMFGFKNMKEGMENNSEYAIRESKRQVLKDGNSTHTLQGALSDGSKEIEYATNNLIHWGILGVVTLILGNDLLNYSKS